ncbi:hypothetical protein [Dapis sp. BLCC M229]|uniref:hypothetical protein n=1 Tax=Dapis sp. BLCC M229 TaxID=3400188 RepID=UPI003CECE95C
MARSPRHPILTECSAFRPLVSPCSKEEGRSKKEEALREAKTLKMVDISPAFTQTIPMEMISYTICRSQRSFCSTRWNTPTRYGGSV